MKKILAVLVLGLSLNATAASTLTKNLVATKVKYNEAKKYYEVSFTLMAGIYKADEKFLKCFEGSIESKKPVAVTYEPMGLKVTNCK